MVTEELNLCMGCMSKLDENGKCRCGYDAEVPVDPACLAPGTTVGGRYLVGRTLEMNGEGITYIGFDKEKEERVFVREFMPQRIAARNELTGIVLPVPGTEPQYKTLLSDYRDLSVALQNLRRCSSILPVLSVFTERNTAYAVYKYVKTISYGDYLLHNGGEFTWAQVKKLFMPLFTSISNLNAAGVLHRGINPKTIRVNSRGQLLLCGFGIGAVRTEGTELDSDLCAGYAAPEQYSEKAWQGPWTDVYSIAAVLYKSLSGTLPADARSRMEIDRLCPPEQLNPYIPVNVAKAIHHAMQVPIDFRTQSVDKFTAELLESPDSNTAIYETHPKKDEKSVSIGLGDTGIFPEKLPEHKKPASAQPSRPHAQAAAPQKVRTRAHAGARWGLITGIVFLSVLTVVVMLILNEYENTLGDGKEESSRNPLVSETEMSGEETVI
ncbi:MAG TPA: protein kinase, partial [Oscillospiraceae bacterium]|nr:protein kinase [Oscillospiraceae bacterium]